ncbi:peptidase S8/S53 domain-containing protein [Calycina marina]|uniref:Peptidase S8/S53 domain-containing protein n=1 Tax=Calycina marina TaxID=1763456 RepID=A0A9P7Z727_9HELO|nr:peptidase S8/S53 domain-containing protein [Calycina marina]
MLGTLHPTTWSQEGATTYELASKFNILDVVSSSYWSVLLLLPDICNPVGGFDKLHNLGIKGKGKGIKIGIVDTGVDYRHLSLGGGFGPGFKFAGGWAFTGDNGEVLNSPDPLTICYGGGHGTHISEILGMNSVLGQFNTVGVAPEASLYMYRAFNCQSKGGSDAIVAAMPKAQADGVDIVNMSLSVGTPSRYSGANDDPPRSQRLFVAAGKVVAAGNTVVGAKVINSLYMAEWPSVEPNVISVGALANKEFPLVYSGIDSTGSTINYASVLPLHLPNGADVYMLKDGCNTDDWTTAMNTVQNVNSTIFAFQVLGDNGCATSYIGNCNGANSIPRYLMAYNADVADPYNKRYGVPSRVQVTSVGNHNL